MTTKNMNPTSSAIDEALWAAYRRDDKAAVMDYLFRRNLGGVGCSPYFAQLVIKGSSKKNGAAKGEYSQPALINGAARQIPLPSTVN
jgi:hypothetical protein